jgi:hypothetical protein
MTLHIYHAGLWYPSSWVQTGLKPSDSSGEIILGMPSFGREVKLSVPCRSFAACKRSRHLPWKSHAVGKIGWAISLPYFLSSLIEVAQVAGRGAPLEMTGETKSGTQRALSYGLGASELQGPGSAPTLLLLLLLLWLYPFLTSVLEGNGCSTPLPGCFPSEKGPLSTFCVGGWVGPDACLDVCGERNISCLYRGKNPDSSSP